MANDRQRDAFATAVEAEIEDSFDEELEMELDDDRLDRLLDETADGADALGLDRRVYFKELFRLQHELVKLQDWVQDQGLKVAVVFEGRDAAGKGGVIKRIVHRLNPRVCRDRGAVGTPTERERHAVVFPALCRASADRPARWCCSTAPGTTVPASSG